MAMTGDLRTQAMMLAYARALEEFFGVYGIDMNHEACVQLLEDSLKAAVRDFWTDFFRRRMDETVGRSLNEP